MSEKRVVLASPHRYADLARIWYRFVRRAIVPAFANLHLQLDVHVFCDANRSYFEDDAFPDVRFSEPGIGRRDFLEFYDGALQERCDYLFFLDADTFFLDCDWVVDQFDRFQDVEVSAMSLVPRRGRPSIFALLCRTEDMRQLPFPTFACGYVSPRNWPGDVNLQPAEFAFRELSRRGRKIVTIEPAQSAKHIANFRGTTGIRTTREHIVHACGEQAFHNFVAQNSAVLAAAYDNILLGALYERLFNEPFAVGACGRPLSGSMTIAEFECALERLDERTAIDKLCERFRRAEGAILQMAARERVSLTIPRVGCIDSLRDKCRRIQSRAGRR